MATDGPSTSIDAIAARDSFTQADSVLASARARMLVLTLAFVLALVAGLGSVGLWGARESRLAACVADVARNGNWLVPDLWGRPRLEKPPLPYWPSAAAAVVTGRLNEWTLRLPALLAAVVILASVYYLGSEAGSPVVGLLASLFLLSSYYFVSELRQPSSDLYLTAFSAAAIAAWWRGSRETTSRGRWWLLAGLCVGLAGACKGPVVLVVIGPPFVARCIHERAWRAPSRTAWASIAIAVVLALAWPAAVLWTEPQALELWFRQHGIKVAHRPTLWRAVTEPQFYLLKWPEYLFPWSVVAVAGVRWGFARRTSAVPPVVRLAWWWFFGNLLVFTLFSARKNYYLMPAVPGLAVLAAYTAFRYGAVGRGWLGRVERAVYFGQLAMIVAMGLVLTFIAWSRLDAGRWLGVAIGVGLTCASAANFGWLLFRPSRATAYAVAGLALSATIGLVYSTILPSSIDARSSRGFARELAEQVPEHASIYFWGEPDPSLWFYLNREFRPIHRLPADAVSEAFCLVKRRDLDLEPDLAPRLVPVVSDPRGADRGKLALTRLALPLGPDTHVYSEPGSSLRHYERKRKPPRPTDVADRSRGTTPARAAASSNFAQLPRRADTAEGTTD